VGVDAIEDDHLVTLRQLTNSTSTLKEDLEK